MIDYDVKQEEKIEVVVLGMTNEDDTLKLVPTRSIFYNWVAFAATGPGDDKDDDYDDPVDDDDDTEDEDAVGG